ncbi:Pyruvate kinase [Cucumispora dikerogammari]|nr:Pyruvate kinase [Cucumispora dikerogammari]
MHKKIICTLNISRPSDIKLLYNSGSDVIRINFSHVHTAQDYENLNTAIKLYTELLAKTPNKNCCLAFDTNGPEIRTLNTISFKEDEPVMFVTSEYSSLIRNKNNKEEIKTCNLTLVKFNKDLKIHEHITVGKIKFKIIETSPVYLLTIALCDGIIEKYKSVSIPRFFDSREKNLHKYLSEKDKEVLNLAESYKIPILFLSFIQNEYQVIETKLYLASLNEKYQPIIISKIEDRIGVENFIKINEESDGAMIARGDLYANIGVKNSFSAYLYLVSPKPDISRSKILILATGICESLGEKTVLETQVIKKTEISEIGFAVTNEIIDSLMFDETATGDIENILSSVKSVVCDTEKYLYSCFKKTDNKEFCMCKEESCISSNMVKEEFFSFLNYKRICAERLKFYNKQLKEFSQLPDYLPYSVEIKKIVSKKEIVLFQFPTVFLVEGKCNRFSMHQGVYYLK